MSITITHSSGFFSCCSIRLDAIIYFININKEFPLIVDSSKQFSWYKPLNYDGDITYEYFEHSDNMGKNIVLNDSVNIDYFQNYQFIDYSLLDFNQICPIVLKYFYPSNQIVDIIKRMEEKYNLDYDNICVLFYRGNDKNLETTICGYNDYIEYAQRMLQQKPNIRFLIQSDETEFIELMIHTFPHNSFFFKDEIRHMNKCDNSTVDVYYTHLNHNASKYYLGITIIMSKCEYIICGSGNCSIWIVLYRGNTKNVYQNLNNHWLKQN